MNGLGATLYPISLSWGAVPVKYTSKPGVPVVGRAWIGSPSGWRTLTLKENVWVSPAAVTIVGNITRPSSACAMVFPAAAPPRTTVTS